MVYRKNFIAVVKCNNKILREQYDKDHDENMVTIPFGSEFSILFKNQDSRRVIVSVSIDGENVTKGGHLIIEPNTSFEFERFLDNLNSGNKFKFVKKIKEIVEYRGDRIDDGIIRIEYWYEKSKPVEDIYNIKFGQKEYIPYPVYQPPIIIREKEYTPHTPYLHTPSTPYIWYTNTPPYYTYCSSNNSSISNMSFNNSNVEGSDLSNTVLTKNIDINYVYNNFISESEGVTVKGSKSEQAFEMVSGIETESQSVVICIKLCGFNRNINEDIKIPVTVDTKITCDKCGKEHKSSKDYCDKCGNCLN